MKPFLETILRLDANHDCAELIQFVQNTKLDADTTLQAIIELLSMGRLRPAYIMAMPLANAGYAHGAIAVARSLGGMVYNNPQEQVGGLQELHTLAQTMEPSQQLTLLDNVLIPTMVPLLIPAIEQGRYEPILHMLEVIKTVFPLFSTRFDFSVKTTAGWLQERLQQSQKQPLPSPLPLPPKNTPRQQRRIVVAMRELIFPHYPKSLPLAIGPRIVETLNRYGWLATFFSMKCLHLIEECQSIAELCRQYQADILILDEETMTNTKAMRTRLITQLRQEMPHLKVVGILSDTQTFSQDDLIHTTDHVDMLLNTTSPSLPCWSQTEIAHKVLHIHIPHAGMQGDTQRPLTGKLMFFNSVSYANWHVAFWLAAIKQMGLPLEVRLAANQSNRGSTRDNDAAYLQALGAATCCINFSSHPGQTTTKIGHGLEIILSGSLLVQETSPDMQRLFVAGEHYLEFSNLAELAAIVRFIQEQRGEAEKIRQRGHQFAYERYRDEKWIGHLEQHLYYADQALTQPSFLELTQTQVALKIVDIGANPLIDTHPPYKPLLERGAELVGFEPNAEGLDELNKQKGRHETYLPHAVGDGKRHPLHFCRAQGMTSLLKPNPNTLKLFYGLPRWGEVLSVEEVETVRLDDIPETAGANLLKMDIQGAELMVLQHAEKRLRELLVIQVEVEFMPLYQNQPLFTDIDLFLRQRGFMFHRFFPTVSRVIQPFVPVDTHNAIAGMSQLLWADALFIRDFTKLDRFTNPDLLNMAAILHDCYQSYDLVLHLLTEYQQRTSQKIGTLYYKKLLNYWPFGQQFMLGEEK